MRLPTCSDNRYQVCVTSDALGEGPASHGMLQEGLLGEIAPDDGFNSKESVRAEPKASAKTLAGEQECGRAMLRLKVI